MAKVKRHRKGGELRRSANPIAARPPHCRPAVQPSPAADALRREKIIPVVKKLSSGSAADRAEAMAAAVSLLDDDTCRFLLLKERIVQKLVEDLVHDSAESVVALAWRALRVIGEREGYDHCVNMFRRDILSKISRALGKLSGDVQSAASDAAMMTADTDSMHHVWGFVDTIVGLLTCLSGTSENILDAVTKIPDLLAFLMGLLKPAAGSPEDTVVGVAQCLSSITDNNDELTRAIAERPEYVSLLLNLRASSNPLVRVCACATLHNVSLGPSEPDSYRSDAVLLPTLTSFVKRAVSLDLRSCSLDSASEEDKRGLRAVLIALEVVASIATALGYDLEQGSVESDGIKVLDGFDDELDRSMADGLHEDMEMVTAGDGDDDAAGGPAAIGSPDAESIVKYLLDDTMPAILLLSQPLPQTLMAVQLRALAALNNIAWAMDLAAATHPPVLSRWREYTSAIWADVVSPVLAGNTADIDLAEAITDVAWAVARHEKGHVDLENSQHKSFIALYNAATSSENLGAKCVGVLGSLALPQERLEVNKDIGVFLMGLVNEAPKTPARPCVEALDALFDIYADADYAYDEPVFVKNGFIKYLEAAVPGIRTMVKRIDKKKNQELRRKAEEVLMNLTRFIQYKKKEAAKREERAEENQQGDGMET